MLSTACQRTAALLKPDRRQDQSIIRIGIQTRCAAHHPAHFNCLDQLLEKCKSQEVILVLICADEDIQKRTIERYGSRLLLPQREPLKVTHVQNRCVVRLFELTDEFMLELSPQYAQVIYFRKWWPYHITVQNIAGTDCVCSLRLGGSNVTSIGVL